MVKLNEQKLLKKTLIRAFFFNAFVEAMIGPNILYLAMGHGKI